MSQGSSLLLPYAPTLSEPLHIAMMIRSPLLFAGLLLLGNAYAQQNTIVVSATRGETMVEEMYLHTTLISREEIEKYSGLTLDQVLRAVPGLNITAVPAPLSDPTGHQTKMRGLGNAKVLVLLDGVPIHDPFYLTTQWFKVPLSSIERIEVVRGGNSSLWGNMAVAGVVNIITRAPRDNAGEVVLAAGSQTTRSASVMKNFVLTDTLALTLNAAEFTTQGYQTTPTEYLWRFPQKEPVAAINRNAQVAVHFGPLANVQAFLRMGYHVQDQDISYDYGRNLQKNPDISAGISTRLASGARVQAKAWAQYVSFEKQNGNSCYLQGSGSCLTSSSSGLAPGAAISNIIQYFTQYGSQRYHEQGASLTYEQSTAPVMNGFQLGIDLRRLSARDAEWFYGTPASASAPQGNAGGSTFGNGRQSFAGIFGQTRLNPIPDLELTVSARLDQWRNTDRYNTRTNASGLTTGGEIAASTKSAFDPGVAARYQLSDHLALRAAAYKSFRAPGFNNVTRTYGSPSPTIANPYLEPENLRGRELGADFDHGDIRIGATAFIYSIRNMIATFKVTSAATAPEMVRTICGTTLSDCAGSASFYTNDQDGESHGVELVARWQASQRLSVDGNYTRTESYLSRHGSVVTDPVGVQIAGLPRDVAALGVTWRPTPSWRLFAEWRYVGPMLLDSTSNGGTVRFGQGGNTLLNASAGYAWSRETELSLSGSNLLNREYSENSYTYNQPYNRILSQPRSFFAALKIRF